MEGAAVYMMLAATAASGAYTAYSQNEAAKTNDAMTSFNYEVEQNNARLQQRYRELEAKTQEGQIELSAVISEANAINLDKAAANAEATARENMSRKRQDFLRLRSRQRAKIAAGGVIEAGSPIEVMAATASEMELSVQDMMVESEARQRDLLNQAQNERFGASQTLFAGKQSVESARVAAGLNASNARTSAEINRMTGGAESSAMRAAAVGTLFETAGTLSQQNFQAKQAGAYKTG